MWSMTAFREALLYSRIELDEGENDERGVGLIVFKDAANVF